MANNYMGKDAGEEERGTWWGRRGKRTASGKVVSKSKFHYANFQNIYSLKV